MSVATGTAIAIGVGAAGAAASAYAAKKQSDAAKEAARLQMQASTHATDIQSTASDAALKYQQQQSDLAQRQFQDTQRANYDQWSAGSQNSYAQAVAAAQNDRNAALAGGKNTYNTWAARERRMGKLGDMLGMGPREIPDYVEPPALIVPELNMPGYAGGGEGGGGTGQNFDPAYIGQQLDNIYAQHGVSATGPGSGPTDKAYMIQAIQKNKGWDPAYWGPRVSQELAKVGIRPKAAAPAYQGTAGDVLH